MCIRQDHNYIGNEVIKVVLGEIGGGNHCWAASLPPRLHSFFVIHASLPPLFPWPQGTFIVTNLSITIGYKPNFAVIDSKYIIIDYALFKKYFAYLQKVLQKMMKKDEVMKNNL